MCSSSFHHQLPFFKKLFMNGRFTHNFLHLRPNWQRNATYLFCSTVIKRNMNTATMKSWQASRNGLSNLNLTTIDIPTIIKPNEVLVKVCAASVNPLDVLMLDDGYGSVAFEFLRSFGSLTDSVNRPRFPFTCGRDFVGEVVRVGHSVSDIQVNDKVWGVVMPQKPGSHAEYVVTCNSFVCHKPKNISDVEAASIPFVGLTAWSAAVLFGNLIPERCSGMQIAIPGASGGVGTFLTQLLSSWGAEVTGICKKDAFELVKSCGASEVFDYEDPETYEILTSEPRFHMVIDVAGSNSSDLSEMLKDSKTPTLISLFSPLMKNIDENGLLVGTAKTMAEYVKLNTFTTPDNVTLKWAFFYPSKEALQHIGKLMEERKIRPTIDKVFKMKELVSAYEHVKNGPVRGKTVIDFTS